MDDPKLIAVAHMVGATGAKQFQIRYSDDEQPVVWMAVATYAGDGVQVAAAITPEVAAWELAEKLLDGGKCNLCGKPTMLLDDQRPALPPGFTAPVEFCVYRLRNNKIVRGCDSLPVGTR
jgi:hypothetical protein